MIEKKRLISLDAFRGLTIAFMLLVNNAGDWDHVYRQLEHAGWNGCTAADMVFPFFVFIMGVAMPLGIIPQLERGISIGQLGRNILRRTAILFGLGVILSTVAFWSYMDHFRLMGVLQRLALTYLFLAIIILLNNRSLEAALFWVILILYAGALFLYASTHGDSSFALPMFYNLSDLIDTKILGSMNYTYDKILLLGHDPEGLFSTIPSISSGLAGVFCGRMLLEYKSAMHTFLKLILSGLGMITLGFLSQYVIPFNKNLWTPSYVIYSTGWALFSLGIFFYLIDVKKYFKPFYPLIAYGSNAISIYFAASIVAPLTVGIRWIDAAGESVRLKTFMYKSTYAQLISPYFGDYIPSTLWGITYVILFFFLADWMFRKKLFVKI
ncbi:MAG: DUF1624 domain-containing protein [Candidatus Riflebacteria bacterium]|nr:DUF1624 domain-containing protein [Candidatus Riflebacteria bacterium]